MAIAPDRILVADAVTTDVALDTAQIDVSTNGDQFTGPEAFSSRSVAADAAGNVIVGRVRNNVASFNRLTIGNGEFTTLQNGVLYVVPNNGEARAIDAKTGKKLWAHHVGSLNASSPAWANNRLFITTLSGTFTCLNAKNGKEVWKKEIASFDGPVRAGDTGCRQLPPRANQVLTIGMSARELLDDFADLRGRDVFEHLNARPR